MKKLSAMSKDELKHLIRLGRKEFLTVSDREEMASDLLHSPEFKGIKKAKTLTDYFGCKSYAANYNQFLTAAEWLESRLGNDKFSILLEHSSLEAYA